MIQFIELVRMGRSILSALQSTRNQTSDDENNLLPLSVVEKNNQGINTIEASNQIVPLRRVSCVHVKNFEARCGQLKRKKTI